jgi:aryl-alcohol dehydrogenase-like predicted oxidoreductase
MKLRPLGKTEMLVSEVGLGAMPLSIAGRPRESEAIKVIHAALDAGMTLVDTADSYCLDQRDIGHNERLIGLALRERPASKRPPMVATKGGLERPGGDWTVNAHPDRLRAACEASLRALGVDVIELYQLHAPDPRVPFAESVGTLAELQRAGKIRHVGVSNVSVKQLDEARRITPIVSVQNRYNLGDRSSEDVLAACERLGIAFLPWYPLGAGSCLRSSPVKKIAARHGASPAQIALCWLLERSPVMLPIPGTASVVHLEENVRAAELKLSAAELAALD